MLILLPNLFSGTVPLTFSQHESPNKRIVVIWWKNPHQIMCEWGILSRACCKIRGEACCEHGEITAVTLCHPKYWSSDSMLWQKDSGVRINPIILWHVSFLHVYVCREIGDNRVRGWQKSAATTTALAVLQHAISNMSVHFHLRTSRFSWFIPQLSAVG